MPTRNLYKNVRISTVHNSQESKQAKYSSTDGFFLKKNVVFTVGEIFYSYKTRWHTDALPSTDEPQQYEAM